MKLLTVTMPCYNSAEYMSKNIDTLLVGGEDVEILLIDDGSTDDTLRIARAYEEQYPSIVRVIHQDNAGHGGAVNTGIRNATGHYFKVVDSDDWVNSDAFRQVLSTLRAFQESQTWVDMVITDFVFDKVGVKTPSVMRYDRAIPANRVLTWDDLPSLPMTLYMIMHAVIYRTKLLQEINLTLPLHTFYVDALYVHIPMEHVKRLYYCNVPLYHYFIGREDQSIVESTMIRRIDQQLLVNRLMVSSVRLETIKHPRHYQYLFRYVNYITMITTLLLMRINSEESEQMRRELWSDIQRENPWMYQKLRYGLVGRILHLPGKTGRRIILFLYDYFQKRFRV